jgi:eukaryotic-like serine/threonine-protein kinase
VLTPGHRCSPSALRSILLATNEIPGNTGDGAVVLEQDGTDLLNDSATIDNHACLSAWAPAQQPVYANRGYTGAAVQVLRTLYRNMLQNSVIQAVVFFPNQDAASLPLQPQRQQWQGCVGKTVTITPAGAPAPGCR